MMRSPVPESAARSECTLPTARRSRRKNGRRPAGLFPPPAPQLPSLEVVPDGGFEAFLSNVMGQHCIVAYGDWRKPLAEYCAINGIRLVK